MFETATRKQQEVTCTVWLGNWSEIPAPSKLMLNAEIHS